MNQNFEPFLEHTDNDLPTQHRTDSIVSSISPSERDYQPQSIGMHQSDSVNSSRSTFSTAASFFNSHKPHIIHHHNRTHGHRPQESSQMLLPQNSLSTNLALKERKPRHVLPSTQPNHHHHHHHHHPSLGMLTKSSTQLDSDDWKLSSIQQQSQQDKQKHTGFFKSLKKSHTTNNESTISLNNSNASSVSLLYGNQFENPDNFVKNSSTIDVNKPAPPNSPQLSSSAKPTRTINFKSQKENLFNQYQFFLKFQSNAKRSDAIDYAPLRLESMNEYLSEIYELATLRISGPSKNKLATLSEKSSITGSTTSLARYATLTNTLLPSDFENLSPVKSTDTTKTFSTIDTAETSLSNSLLTPEKIRVILMELWMIQAWKMLAGSHSMLIPEIRKKSMANFASTHRKNSMVSSKHQICYLQNQMKEANGLLKGDGQLDESSLNWNLGWQLSNDESDSWVNSVFLNDWDLTTNIIIDPNSVGKRPSLQLSDDLSHLENSPIVHLAQKKKHDFLSNYSLFTTTTYTDIPLKSATQNIVYCHDLESSVKKNDWNSALTEIKRILVPGGFVQFVIKDFEIYDDQNKTTHEMNKDTAPQKIWKLIRENAENSNFELRPSRKICQWLKEAGFKDIKYSLLTAPKTVTPISGYEKPDESTLESHSSRNPSMVSTSTDGTSSTASSQSTTGIESSDVKPYDKSNSSVSLKEHHSGHKTSFYKDERLNNFSSLLTGLTEYRFLKFFTHLLGVDVSTQDDAALIEYLNYRRYGDGSGRIFYDEGYCLFMNVTAMK